MLIDPFTVVAQIINFLILVALLKHFLYGPITRAMTQREQTITERLEHAEQQETLARQEAKKLQQMQQEFAVHRDQRMAQLRSQLEDQRLTLLATVEADVNAIRSRWLHALDQEKAIALRTVRQQAAYQLSQTLRQILQDLANISLEQQIVSTFVDLLEQLPPSEQQSLQSALFQTDGVPVLIRSSFPLEAASQTALTEALQRLGSKQSAPQFEIDSNLGCGIELVAPGYKLAWNLTAYLDTLEHKLALTLDQALPSESKTLSA